MTPKMPSPIAARRRFLQSLAASLPLLGINACHDEAIVPGTEPADPPQPGAKDYAELLEAYFEAGGLGDADFIGGYTVQTSDMSSSEAFEFTQVTRELIDEADSVEAALSALDERLVLDFVEARVVDVAGWTLARTEVELCILAWLV